MIACKNCKSTRIRKNGTVRGKQRYLCKDCEYNFVEKDDRTSEGNEAKKALIVMLYSLSKASYRTLAKIFKTWPSQVFRWVSEAGLSLKEPEIQSDIKEMEFDEMWHYIKSKKTSCGSSKLWNVVEIELSPGYWANVILPPLSDCTTKSSI